MTALRPIPRGLHGKTPVRHPTQDRAPDCANRPFAPPVLLIREIEGGGIVYEAEQESLHHSVLTTLYYNPSPRGAASPVADMNNSKLMLKFWGVRGSVPTPVIENLRYGGNTSCLGLGLSGTEHLILDCGTGIRDLGESLGRSKPAIAKSFHIFFSHYHLDHIEGLPFFSPLYDRDSTITFYGFTSGGKSVKEILQTLVAPPYFPVPLAEVPSKVSYVTLDETSHQFGDVRIDTLPLNHPNGSFSFRLERGNRRIIYATDHEHGIADTDSALIRFAKDADYLIYDAMYVPSEYEMLRRGWGHSTWYEAVHVARAAGVKTLVLFHHHPGHTDEQLEAVLAVAREELPSVEIAREGMDLPL